MAHNAVLDRIGEPRTWQEAIDILQVFGWVICTNTILFACTIIHLQQTETPFTYEQIGGWWVVELTER